MLDQVEIDERKNQQRILIRIHKWIVETESAKIKRWFN